MLGEILAALLESSLLPHLSSSDYLDADKFEKLTAAVEALLLGEFQAACSR